MNSATEDLKQTYKYPWKHPIDERPQGCCYDCGMEYKDFHDMVVPDDVWEKISPTHWQGAGLLCPTCMVNRLALINEWYETGFFLLKEKPTAFSSTQPS